MFEARLFLPRIADGFASAELTQALKWRMGWDSNPRWASTHGGFQDRCLKPLGHPSFRIGAPYRGGAAKLQTPF